MPLIIEGKECACLGDPTTHGSPLLPGPGALTVLYNGRPIWRVGMDFHTCPVVKGVVPDVGGVVMLGALRTVVMGAPAARKGDIVVEIPGGPNPIVLGAMGAPGGGSKQEKKDEPAQAKPDESKQKRLAPESKTENKPPADAPADAGAAPPAADTTAAPASDTTAAPASDTTAAPASAASRDELQAKMEACGHDPEKLREFQEQNPQWTNGLEKPPETLTLGADRKPLPNQGDKWTEVRDYRDDMIFKSPHEGLVPDPTDPSLANRRATFEMRQAADNGTQALPSARTQAVYDQNGNLLAGVDKNGKYWSEGTPDLRDGTISHIRDDYLPYKNELDTKGPIAGDMAYRARSNAPMPDGYYQQDYWKKAQRDFEESR